MSSGNLKNGKLYTSKQYTHNSSKIDYDFTPKRKQRPHNTIHELGEIIRYKDYWVFSLTATENHCSEM